MSEITTTPGWISCRMREGARAIGMPYETFRSYVRKGLIPCSRIGRAVYVRRRDLEKFVNDHMDAPAADRPAQERGADGKFIG